MFDKPFSTFFRDSIFRSIEQAVKFQLPAVGKKSLEKEGYVIRLSKNDIELTLRFLIHNPFQTNATLRKATWRAFNQRNTEIKRTDCSRVIYFARTSPGEGSNGPLLFKTRSLSPIFNSHSFFFLHTNVYSAVIYSYTL